VIRSVEIKGLRGIREGKLTDLGRLVVLVGPNGCGKSTVIEGILIGASPTTSEAIVEVIRRHEGGGSGPRWLLWRTGFSQPTEITIRTKEKTQKCSLQIDQGRPAELTRISFIVSNVVTNQNELGGWIQAVRNKHQNHSEATFRPLGDVSEVHLVEAYPTSLQSPLHELYTKAVRLGRRKEAFGIISEVIPDAINVEILTEIGEPILHLVFADYSVPATLCGDGIQSLLRLSLELAATGAEGVALLEEPEVHQHPGAIRQSARAIIAAVRRNIQVILTTHSLELIDALVGESLDKDLEQMSLYRLMLEDGILKSSRLAGPDIAFSRTEVESDLR